MPEKTTKTKSQGTYLETVGRRKTSVARIRMYPGTKTSIEINERPLAEYFPTADLQKTAKEALDKSTENFSITVMVKGGGISSQAEAVRLGIARALVEGNRDLRTPLKKEGFLKRDARAKERRKFGLKKARKAPQWSKR